ncbi:MAG TPA: TetR/AcrR family transcriptional regulator [Armatimonadota bacterium]|jgi:AcrR family transcriptional regulator
MRHTVCDDLRNDILDVVGDLLKRYGYRKMTVDDIAHEVGIGKGTVYHFFPSKEEIAFAWLDSSNVKMRETLQEIASSEGRPTERLRRMLIKRVMLRFDASQDFRESIEELFSDMRTAFLSRRQANHIAEAHIFSVVLAEGLRNGDFDVDNCDFVAEMLLLATNSLLPYSLSAAQLGNRDEIEDKAARIADIVLNGLIKRS